MTVAEAISLVFGDDGQKMTLGKSDVSIGDFCESAEGHLETNFDSERWTFHDGSVITIQAEVWDLGYPDCWCWQGAGHADGCKEVDKGNPMIYL